MSLLERVKPGISRRVDFALRRTKCALLIIDIQKYFTYPEHEYYMKVGLPRSLKNIEKLKTQFHAARESPNCNSGCEVIFTYVQSSTKDGRDVSLDYKLSGPMLANIPRVGDTDIFLDDCTPDIYTGKGDILLPKTSCSVFQSTNLDYLLRNLGIEQIVVCGQLTDECVESAVRDGADLGYLMTVPEDACAAISPERHKIGLQGMHGFCRILKTAHIIWEIAESVDTYQTDNISLESLTTFLKGRGYTEAAIEVASAYSNGKNGNKKASPRLSTSSQQQNHHQQQHDEITAVGSNEDIMTVSSVVADNIRHQDQHQVSNNHSNNTNKSPQQSPKHHHHPSTTTSPTSNHRSVKSPTTHHNNDAITPTTTNTAVLPAYNNTHHDVNGRRDPSELVTPDLTKRGRDPSVIVLGTSTTTMSSSNTSKITNLTGSQYQQQVKHNNNNNNNHDSSNHNHKESTSIINASSTSTTTTTSSAATPVKPSSQRSIQRHRSSSKSIPVDVDDLTDDARHAYSHHKQKSSNRMIDPPDSSPTNNELLEL